MCADRLDDLVGLALGILEAHAGRQLGGDDDAALVRLRHEALRQELHHRQRAEEQDEADGHREVGGVRTHDDAGAAERHGDAQRPALQRHPEEAGIGAHDHAVARLHMMLRAQEVGRHHRRDQAGDQEREQHGGRDDQAELLEVLAGDAAHEADRREDRDDRQGDRHDREPDLVGRLDRRPCRATCPSSCGGRCSRSRRWRRRRGCRSRG